jgi:hypothetical protein
MEAALEEVLAGSVRAGARRRRSREDALLAPAPSDPFLSCPDPPYSPLPARSRVVGSAEYTYNDTFSFSSFEALPFRHHCLRAQNFEANFKVHIVQNFVEKFSIFFVPPVPS